MAVTSERIHLGGLARKLVIDGLLEEDTATEVFQESMNDGVPFVSLVVSKKLADAGAVAQAAAEEFGTPLVDVSAVDRKSTRLNSSHSQQSRMPSSA